MKAVIQAGGAGTRLKEITGDLPKPMVPLCGKPILEWQIESFKRSGIDEFIFIISKNGQSIKDYFGDGSKFGASIEYIQENEPLGTGGALYYLKDKVDDYFILCFGDLMLDVSWDRFIKFHKEKGGCISAFVHPNSHPFDSDVLVLDKDERILGIDPKGQVRDHYYHNLTNAGLYVCSSHILHLFQKPEKIDFEKHVLNRAINHGHAFAYRSSEYVKDCGTPDRYAAVSKDIKEGVVAAKCLKNKQKCIFLDRDGTLNVFGDFVRKADMLKMSDEAAPSLKRINESEYLAICVTNQPVIARGECSFEEMDKILSKMEDELGNGGAYLNDTFFCPHHPDKGFEGEVPELKIDCDCRKPKPGMFYKARDKYNIDLSQSWMIGDTKQDVQAGINAGCKTILLTCGDPEYDRRYKEAVPDHICSSLTEAIDIILGKGN